MIPIYIDLSGLQQQFSLAKGIVNDITELCVNEVEKQVYNNWVALAKRSMNSTRNGYLQGLVRVDKGKFEKSIILTGVFNNMLEEGFSAFDMKNGFAKSSKRKFNKKGGWYLTIPFRHGAAGTLGASSSFQNILPTDIHDIVKTYIAGKQLTQSNIPKPFDSIKTRKTIIIPSTGKKFDAYTHKSSIYAGVSKSTAAYGSTTQNTYKSFRRVSEKSDPMSWIHSGITAFRLSDKAVNNTPVDIIVNNTAKQFLETIL